jgi:HlyD family secretion protein
MNNLIPLTVAFIFILSCKSKTEKIHASREDITESVYASGIVKSANQYQVFATVNGIIDQVFVSEGDTVTKGTPLLYISNETSKLQTQNAELAAAFSDFNANKNRLNELKITIDFAFNKLNNDSLQYIRQQNLFTQQVGSERDLEQSLLTYQNSKSTYQTAVLRYDELKKQLNFTSKQSKKNLLISQKLENDFTIRSEINGRVYNLLKEKGEMVTTQTPLAIVGDATHFKIELQVDEYDIVKVQKGQKIMLSLDSYRGEIFEATVEKINPIMNERTKTFTIEALFNKAPHTLYPNLTIEANIVIQTRKNTLTIPRNVLSDSNTVTQSDGSIVKVKTGLKDFKKVEILSGIDISDELIIPVK